MAVLPGPKRRRRITRVFGRIGRAISRSNPTNLCAQKLKNALIIPAMGAPNGEKQTIRMKLNRPFYYSDIFVDPE